VWADSGWGEVLCENCERGTWRGLGGRICCIVFVDVVVVVVADAAAANNNTNTSTTTTNKNINNNLLVTESCTTQFSNLQHTVCY
jgi:hypothetical protein